jgi:hypothetical protein
MTAPASHSTPSPGAPIAQPGPKRFLTGAEQSRLSWARVPESYDEIPPVYRPWLDALVGSREPLPHIVLTPTYEGYLRRENEKLVCLVDGTFHIVERTRDHLLPVSYRLENITCVETGSILLRGWLSVRGIADEGQPASTTVRFNTVTERLFAPLLSEIRAGSHPPSGADLDAERSKFQELLSENYKFMNFSRSSILAGEEVLCYVLQPELRRQLLRISGRALSHCISPTHIAILTDRELILISEENESWRQSFSRVRYGGIWHYVPLPKISAAAVTLREDGLLKMCIDLPCEEKLERLFAPTSGSQVDELVARIG